MTSVQNQTKNTMEEKVMEVQTEIKVTQIEMRNAL
jgi:hypothetical protein